MKKLNRTVYAAVGIIVLLLAGLVYAWSVLASPIGLYFDKWSNAQLSLTFTICMVCFCIGGVIGGITNDKVNVRISVLISAIMFLAGFIIASSANDTVTLYVGYGALCGFASGLVYNAVMSTISKWFPDKPGLISGVLLMGFGFGSFLIGKIYQAVTPAGAGIDDWRKSFIVLGILLFVVLIVGSIFFVKPSEDDIAKIMSGKNCSTTNANEDQLEVTPFQMLRTSSFWFFFIWAILLSAAGMALISQASGVAMEAGENVSASTIATVVGLISIFNGIGRVIFGGLFDKLKRGKTMTIITISFIVSVSIVLLALVQKNFFLLIVGFIYTGFSYGGITPTNSAFISTYYGTKNYPVNFSIVNMNLLFASFGSILAGILYDNSGSYISTFIIMIGVSAVALVSSLLIKEPKLEQEEKQSVLSSSSIRHKN